MGFMKDHIGEPAMYEQMAEECVELAKAALKMARILRNENPTPVTASEMHNAIIEEYTDIVNCANELGIHSSPTIAKYKMERFKARWEEAHKEVDMTTKEFVESLSKEELETLKKLLNTYKEDKKENDDRSRDRKA